MTVEFVDKESGEIVEPARASRRARRKAKDSEEKIRVNIGPVLWIVSVILAFLIGGTMGTAFAQDEIERLEKRVATYVETE